MNKQQKWEKLVNDYQDLINHALWKVRDSYLEYELELIENHIADEVYDIFHKSLEDSVTQLKFKAKCNIEGTDK